MGVLDKSVLVLDAVADGATALAEVAERSGLPKATAHRLVVALEAHGLLRREAGGLALGLRLIALGRRAADAWPLARAAAPALEWLRDATGESVQLFVRSGDRRLCVASLESAEELRTIVEVGALLPLDRGSGGRALIADVGSGSPSKPRPLVESVEERAPGVASVSAAATVDGARVAVSVSGPVERMTRHPGRRFGSKLRRAADRIEASAPR